MRTIGGALALAFLLASPTAHGATAPLPAGWPYPGTLELGVNNSETASAIRSWGQVKFRYSYLTAGWRTWDAVDGGFAAGTIANAVNNGLVPVLTNYVMLGVGGSTTGGEGATFMRNLADPATMRKYFDDFRVLLQKAAGFPNNKVVVHLEPDLWGTIHARSTGDDAATVPAAVASTGISELADLPDTAAGYAQALVRMRGLYAPNVFLGFHPSIWGTGFDLDGAQAADIPALAERSAAFYRSLGAAFDLSFYDHSDRDAGFRGASAFWDAAKYDKHLGWMSGFTAGSDLRAVLWQIPLGNRVMRSMNNTTNHYQSFQVEDLIGDPARAMLTRYRDAGVVAILFGAGANTQTHYVDQAKDGITNPAPINGNDRTSTVADDDGGYFRERVQAYYVAGPMALEGSDEPPPPPPPPAEDTSPPTVPTGLRATNVGRSSVTLAWNASQDDVGVTQYAVLRNGTRIALVPGTTYQATELKRRTGYRFAVRAFDAAGNASALTPELTVRTN
jgi:hypothetical protein